MKKIKKIGLISTLALFSLTLGACDTGKDSKSEKPSENITDATSDSTETTYQISFIKDDFVEIETSGLTENRAKPGSSVSFTLSIADSRYELTSVSLEEDLLTAKDGEYHFTMPDHDVSITILGKTLGEASLLDIKDVDVSSIPSTVSGFKTYLEKSIAVEGTYFQSGHYTNNNFIGSNYQENYEVIAGNNDVLSMKGQILSYASDAKTSFASKEIGRQGKKYYSISETTSISDSSSSDDKTYTFKNIIDDDSENVGLSEIKESDAKAEYSSMGGAKFIYDAFFSSQASYPIKEWTENVSTYNYYLKDISKAISSDKKHITFDLGIYYPQGWLGTDYFQVQMTFDGDFFLNSASIERKSFDSDDCDSSTYLPNDMTKGEMKSSYSLSMTRGYKKEIEKSDIQAFAMKDYDVNISYELNGENKETDLENVIVENESTLSFRYFSHDLTPNLILPTLKGVEEGEEYFDVKEKKVLKEGNFTLVFDNGFGEEKKVKVTSIQPKPTSITVSAPSTLFLNEPTTFSFLVEPEKATQNVTVTVKDSSTGTAEISKNNDGTYTVKGTKIGQIDLLITSDADAEIKKEYSFAIVEKPNAATFKNNVLTKTFYGENSSYKAVVNLKEDGSGEFKTSTSGMYSYYEQSRTIHWTFSEETLTFTITDGVGSYYTGRSFLSLKALTDDSATGAFQDFSYYSDDATDFTLTLTAQDRKDLSDFE